MNIDESISHTMALLPGRTILATAMLSSCVGEAIALAHAKFMPAARTELLGTVPAIG